MTGHDELSDLTRTFAERECGLTSEVPAMTGRLSATETTPWTVRCDANGNAVPFTGDRRKGTAENRWRPVEDPG
ncbi:hypothetical protein ACFWZ2_30080 [Streptomyces sp. NPDC059002]|uniref:hypothetical protein n=1 Tax=Streptomyces sp. NPDC059002 TaxID=3346690 RepID=UPI0036BEBACE